MLPMANACGGSSTVTAAMPDKQAKLWSWEIS